MIFVLLAPVFSGVFFSCNDQKTLQEMLREEKKAIERFIDRNDFVVLDSYPKDSIFGEKEYYKTNDGLYIHVVDRGSSVRAKALDNVTIRFEYQHSVKDAARGDTTTIIKPSLLYPFSFVYGISQTYSVTSSPVCVGWVIPLAYIGEGAVVDIIIPSSIGSYSDSNSILPVFYKNLRYTSFN
ncbi:hypothetical protein FACS189432_02960 [Bacteroidia bacterium]|nr:hypothetical protein FACS189432_02960 [Bacteroidia bacterium]